MSYEFFTGELVQPSKQILAVVQLEEIRLKTLNKMTKLVLFIHSIFHEYCLRFNIYSYYMFIALTNYASLL